MKAPIIILLILLVFISGCNDFLISNSGDNSKVYGEFYNKTSGGFTFTPATAGIYYNLTGGSPGALRGFIYHNSAQANGGSHLEAIVGGLYSASAHISGEGINAGGEYGIAIGLNYVRQNNCYANVQGTGAEDVVAIVCLLHIQPGDYINILVEDEAEPTKAFSVHSFNLNLIKIT